MQKLIWQNAKGEELDLTGGNYGITEWEGFSNASLNIQSQQVPFQDGGVFLDALIEQRELTVTLAMQDNNNLELRYQQRRELISALNPKLGEGYLIYTNDFISKRIKCIPQIPLFENHNSNDSGTPKASLTWTACEPYWEDLEETEVEINIGTTESIQNEGDIATQVKVDIEEGSDNPIIINRSTNKKIELKKELVNSVTINTEQGKKSIISNATTFQWKQGGGYRFCAYGNGKYMYVGEEGIVVEDITTGEMKGYPLPQVSAFTVYDVVFVNNIWVILTQSSTPIFYSTDDGQTWNNLEKIDISSEGTTVRDIKYFNGKYIAVSDSGIISTSQDFVVWEKNTQAGYYFYSVAYSEELNTYVVVGYNGVILTSTDLITWTSQTSGVASTISKIIYTGIFVATVSQGIIYSSDGITWANIQFPSSGTIQRICYGNKVYVVRDSHNFVYTSTDLANWTIVLSTYSTNLGGICYGGGQFLFSNNQRAYKSADGIEWEETHNWNVTLCDVAIGNNKYVCISPDTSYVSEDEGKTWTVHPIGITNINLVYLLYANGTFIATGTNGRIITSTDGIEWTQRTSGVSYNLGRIRYFAETGTYIIINSAPTTNAKNAFLFSTDLITWQNRYVRASYIDSFALYDIAYDGEKYLTLGVVDNQMVVFTTTDQTFIDSWVSQPATNITADAVKIITYNRTFTGFTDTKLLISQDGLNWTEYAYNVGKFITFKAIGTIIVDNNIYVIGTTVYGNYCLGIVIGNKINFIEVPAKTLYGIAEKDGKFILVGPNDIMILSEFIEQNIIDTVTTDTDMSFELKQGTNEIGFFADATGKKAIVKYRQKYIGV